MNMKWSFQKKIFHANVYSIEKEKKKEIIDGFSAVITRLTVIHETDFIHCIKQNRIHQLPDTEDLFVLNISQEIC